MLSQHDTATYIVYVNFWGKQVDVHLSDAPGAHRTLDLGPLLRAYPNLCYAFDDAAAEPLRQRYITCAGQQTSERNLWPYASRRVQRAADTLAGRDAELAGCPSARMFGAPRRDAQGREYHSVNIFQRKFHRADTVGVTGPDLGEKMDARGSLVRRPLVEGVMRMRPVVSVQLIVHETRRP